MRFARLLCLGLVLCTVAACSDGTSTAPSAAPIPSASPSVAAGGTALPAPPVATTCGDPAVHVYHPYRLQLLDRCRTVSGVVAAIRSEPDGDYHVLLRLDVQFASMLRPANNALQHGELVLEPICQHRVTQADAIGPCGGGLPLVSLQPVGTHVWATGSYVLDNDHEGWAELHPLFEMHPG
ncbi:MAG: hypothetical protein ABR598_08630 [Candidatus Dormibacteria bacterium]